MQPTQPRAEFVRAKHSWWRQDNAVQAQLPSQEKCLILLAWSPSRQNTQRATGLDGTTLNIVAELQLAYYFP